MKNKLLITTALVAMVSASNVYANERVISEDIANQTNTEPNASGALLVNYGEDVVIADNVNITDNTSTIGAAGGIKALNGFTAGNGLNVSGNKSEKKMGGGMYVRLVDDTDYANNGFTATNRNVVIGDNATISNNSSKWLGGGMAIESAEKVTLGNGATFEGNHSDAEGGAIAIWSDDSNKLNGEAFDNKTLLELGQTKFVNNTSGSNGGAIANLDGNTVNIAAGSIFDGNEAIKDGGAIYNEGTLNIGKDTVFANNEALTGGAVRNYGGTASITGSTFADNLATQNGGAVYNSKGTVSLVGNKFINNKAVDGGAVYNGNGGKIDNLSGVFTENTASGRGGSIYNTKTSKIEKIEGVFTGNTADKGGAISNAGEMTVANSTFSNNESKTSGGAIHNTVDGIVNLTDTNIFSGNIANGKLNDIQNSGAVNVSGNLFLDGGISGTGTTTFAEGTNLNVKTDTTTISNKVVNNGANLGLTFNNGYAGGEYALITDGGTLDNEFNIAENGIYKIQADADNKGTYNISKKSTGEISATTGANANQAGAINAITSGNSDSASFNNVANSINSLMQSSNKADVKAGLDAATALAPEATAMVQSASTENANQVFGAVGSRLSGGSVSSSSEGMSSGDNGLENGAMWVQGLINKSKLDTDNGFDADSSGIAMGAEKYINSNVKAGVGYAYTKTDIDGFMRQTDVDTHTAIAYGEYKPSNWFVNGIATYGWSDYSEKKNVAGNQVKADYDVNTVGLQAMTGYDMNMNSLTVTPEAGLRYVNIKQDAYKDSADQKVGSNSSDILTGVIGAKIKKDIALNNGMNLRPEARLAMTYDLMNDDSNSVVTLANGSAYSVQGEALDRFGVEVGAGLTADINQQIEMSLGYEGKFRQDYSDHTGLVNAKYKF